MSIQPIQRIHHITALGGSAQVTIDFMEEVLGIQLIKATVNFANADAYHLFFANHGNQSQSSMTYFDWADRHEGKDAGGQGGVVAYRASQGSLDYWKDRLEKYGAPYKESQLFGKATLEFTDPFKIKLAIVEGKESHAEPLLYDFHGTALQSIDYRATAAHLENVLGLVRVMETKDAIHFDTRQSDAEPHRILVPKEDMTRRLLGRGTIDHIAFEISDKAELDEWRAHLTALGFENRDLTQQNFKKATYYREPGKVRIELATRGMEFMTSTDEEGELAQKVMIPPHFKDQEEEILNALPHLDLKRRKK